MGCEAMFNGVGDAGGREIGNCHGVAARLTGHGGCEEADGSSAKDESCGAGCDSGAGYGVDGD